MSKNADRGQQVETTRKKANEKKQEMWANTHETRESL